MGVRGRVEKLIKIPGNNSGRGDLHNKKKERVSLVTLLFWQSIVAGWVCGGVLC